MDKKGAKAALNTRDGLLHVNLPLRVRVSALKVGAFVAIMLAYMYFFSTSIWYPESPTELAPIPVRALSPLVRINKQKRFNTATYSRLAQALGPRAVIPELNDSPMCGEYNVNLEYVKRMKIAIAAVTWRAPLSLANSLRSWRTNGLLDIADEKMMFINSPTEADFALAREYDFDIYTTDEHNGNIMAGPSIGYLNANSSADVVLFMEKDFELSSDRDVMMDEMWMGMVQLAQGVDIFRLRGHRDLGNEGQPNCCAAPSTCPYNSNWQGAGFFQDHMNWLFIFCDPDIIEHANGRVAQCSKAPYPVTYCFSSAETNWSNNPVMWRREWFEERLKTVAFADWDRNNMFEFNAMMEWLEWKPPAKVCTSYEGIFTHNEIDQ